MNKLGIALALYVVLALVAWITLSDQRLRWVTLAVLAMFAIRTLVHDSRIRAEAEDN